MSKFKYMNVLLIPILTYFSFTGHGAITYLPIAHSFLLIPFLELFGKPRTENLSETEEELSKDNPIYDWQVYLMVPVQCVFVYLFLESMAEPRL
ncbi:MAG: alkane 1-monooxygenase, partial [Cyclobacteriaceae bacterium]